MKHAAGGARILLVTSVAAVSATQVGAGEGGTSHYLPGIAGDLGYALPPAPGLNVRNILWSQSGDIDETVLGGEEYRDVSIDTTLNIVAATYTLDTTLFGGLYSVGVLAPFGTVSVEGDRVVGGGSVDEHTFGLGDIELIPLQLNWSRGDFHFKVSQSIIAPTGAYDSDEPANVGRNHWSFDTVGAVTWFKEDWGTEVSAALGLMHNAENEGTEYHSGNETHLDFAVNQFLTDSFAVGIRGYRLNQLKGDRGEGAILGPLEGFSRGIGAGFVWKPTAGHGAVEVSGKYMSDFKSRDGRLHADHAELALSWTF